jgi:predicted DsbA family dithiol-disulfide isomerase
MTSAVNAQFEVVGRAEVLMAQGRNVARRQVLLDVATELGGDRPDAFSAIRF